MAGQGSRRSGTLSSVRVEGTAELSDRRRVRTDAGCRIDKEEAMSMSNKTLMRTIANTLSRKSDVPVQEKPVPLTTVPISRRADAKGRSLAAQAARAAAKKADPRVRKSAAKRTESLVASRAKHLEDPRSTRALRRVRKAANAAVMQVKNKVFPRPAAYLTSLP